MARGMIKYNCVVCGAKVEKTAHKYNRKEANEWERWAMANYDKCPSCWGKAQHEAEDAKPLKLTIAIDPFDSIKPYVLIWTGGTRKIKEELKELGYEYGDPPCTSFLGGFDRGFALYRWYKKLTEDEFREKGPAILAEAHKIAPDAVIVTDIDKITLSVAAQNRAEKIKADSKQLEIDKAVAELTKPQKPDCYPSERWNGKIYGRPGSYCIYINRDRIALKSAEVKQIEEYDQNMKEYDAAVKKIKEALQNDDDSTSE